jgi:hypothetical protein
MAPKYALHREVAAVDTLPETVKAHGINMSGYEYAHIQVVPIGGANPNVQVQWWYQNAAGVGKFIQEHTAIAKTGAGANTPFEFSVECRGRIMFVAFTALAAGTAKAFVSGFNRVQPE